MADNTRVYTVPTIDDRKYLILTNSVSAVVPIGAGGPDKRQSVKFSAFGNARLLGELRFDFFPMSLSLYLGLFGARGTRAP